MGFSYILGVCPYNFVFCNNYSIGLVEDYIFMGLGYIRAHKKSNARHLLPHPVRLDTLMVH